jgi:hypothetical protein
LDAVRRKEITDGSSNIKAVSEFSYDDPYTKGNITTEYHWDSEKPPYTAPSLGNLSGSNSQTLTRAYDGSGNVVDFYEPQIRTHITYDSTGAFPLRVDYAYGTPQQRSWTYNWTQPNTTQTTGYLYSKTDLDNNITTSFAYDVVGRQVSVNEAGVRKTATEYDDANLKITVNKDLNSLEDAF